MAKKTDNNALNGNAANGSAANLNSLTSAESARIAALGYEEAVAELEALVQSIESGRTGLEASLVAYGRGEALMSHCRNLLQRAEQTVTQMSLSELEQER